MPNFAQPIDAVKFIPTNRQEHDNQMRALVGSHMGGDFSNPSQWVVDAVHEAFQRGFSLGLQARGAAPMPEQVVRATPKRIENSDVIDV